MSCLSPFIRIRTGCQRWPLEEDGIVKEKGRLMIDLPSNRQKLEELNIPYQVIPCGVCDECYKKRVKEWSIRILNETKYHDENYFITLTYDDLHLPQNRSLNKARVQTFFKSLKKALSRKFENIKIKYYCVGEYGDGKGERNYLNPHYHFIAFGLPLSYLGLTKIFPDGHEHKSQSGDILLYSEFLSHLWPEGFVTIQDVSFGSAAYVAGYVHKKLRDSKPIIHEEVGFYNFKGKSYAFIVPRRYSPYDFLRVEHPWSLMSKGIGEQYIKDHIESIYKTDEVFYNSGNFGIKSSLPPRYYDKKLAQHNLDKSKEIKEKRIALSQGKYCLTSDQEALYNKAINARLAEVKKQNRKRGLTSLS